MLPFLVLLALPCKPVPFDYGEARSLTPFAALCDKLSMSDLHDLIVRLGRVKNFAKLKEIYEAEISGGGYAATVYARGLDGSKVVAFCCRFELGSSNWHAALWGLRYHRKKDVIGYIKQIAQSEDLYVRVACYQVCQRAGWGDLMKQAKKDIGCTLPLMFFCYPGQTVGSVAEEYVKSFSEQDKKRKRARETRKD